MVWFFLDDTHHRVAEVTESWHVLTLPRDAGKVKQTASF